MIHKYVKLPVEIEAVKFTRDNFEEINSFTNGIAKDLQLKDALMGNAGVLFLH